jgi:DNA-binding transcriptional MerR regulator
MTDDALILSQISASPAGKAHAAALTLTNSQSSFTIADLASAFDITPRAIRFYEAEGLITPERRGQSRIFSKRDVARLAWVLRGKRVGFSLSEIKELLDLYDVGDGRLTQREKTLQKCRAQLASLEAQRQDLDQVIDELNDFCRAIENMVLPKTKR